MNTVWRVGVPYHANIVKPVLVFDPVRGRDVLHSPAFVLAKHAGGAPDKWFLPCSIGNGYSRVFYKPRSARVCNGETGKSQIRHSLSPLETLIIQKCPPVILDDVVRHNPAIIECAKLTQIQYRHWIDVQNSTRITPVKFYGADPAIARRVFGCKVYPNPVVENFGSRKLRA